MSSSITNIWIEQDKRVIDFESTLPIPDKDLSNVPSILVKKPTDLDVIPPKGGCYWIWTDEPVKHKFHKGKIPDKVIYNSKEGSIIYNGIAKDNIKARLTHHLFSDQNQGWSGISMDIIPSEPVSHAKKAMSISNNKSKVALLLDGTRINTVQLLSELPLSPSERGFIKTPYRSVFYFRNGINVRDEKHIIFDFVVFYITGLESKSYLEYLEKKWREEYNLPQLCSYKSGR